MQEGKSNSENGFGLLGQTVFKYLPYWPLFLALIAVAIGGALIYLQLKTSLYESTARILVKDEKKGSEDSKIVEGINVLTSKKIVENEIEVIQSRTLVGEIISNLHLYAPVSEKGKFRNSTAYLTSPVLIEVPDVQKIIPVKEIEFEYDKAGIITVEGKKYPLNVWISLSFGKIRFLKNNHYQPSSGNKFVFSLVPAKRMIASLQSRIKVAPSSKQSTIINLNIQDEVPERGEDILNELIRVYTYAMVNDKNTLAQNTMSFVDERLKKVESDLEAIESKNQQYKTGRSAVDISEQGKLFLQNVSNNDQKIGDINMQLAVLNQVEKSIRSRNDGIIPSTLGVTDPVLSQLINKLYTTELEYESMKRTVGENNPSTLAIASQIEKIRPGILDNVESQRRGLEASSRNLAMTNSSYASVLQSIPEKERRLIEINREQSIKNELYAFLLQKREETALSQASRVADTRIIDVAGSSPDPVSPKRKVVFLAAMLLALFSGVSVIALKENFNRKIMFRQEIELLTAQPIIGEIAKERSLNQIVIGDNTRTFIAEQFRRLRASLKFIGITPRRKRILVTSAIGGEGKSFIASNLALSLALTNKRVVLIDCDLNNPSLHIKLNMINDTGVSEFLSGEHDLASILKPTGLHDDLFFISTGKLPRNPSELLMNGRMEQLLDELETQFDYIIVDTAPVSPVTDAYILSPMCNATLFVIRHKYTPKIYIQRIDEDNKINNLKNIALVFNGVNPRGFGRENYGYGYGYGYHQESRYNMRIANA